MSNTHIVPRAQLGREADLHKYVEEASTLGLRPGQWPDYLQIDPPIGNGQPFMRSTPTWHEGELVKVRYHQQWGCVDIEVLND